MEWSSGIGLWLPVLSLTLLYIFVYKKAKSGSNLPPGPKPLPLLGNLLQLRTADIQGCLLKLRDAYGPVYTLHLGPLPIVVLSGYRAVKEALVDQGEQFSGRGELPIMSKTSKGYELLFDPSFCLRRSVSNVICSVVFGCRYDYGDEKFQMLLDLIQENLRRVDNFWVQMYNFFPVILDCFPGPHQELFKNYKKQMQFVEEIMKSHEESLDLTSPRDFIDAFLIKIHQEKGNQTSSFDAENLLVSSLDIFFAGTETTSTTLRYGLLLLLKYPEIEGRIHEEIEHVIGRNRVPCMEDRSKMPYTEAVIHEIQRFIDLLPLGVPHAVTEDTIFRGYTIPKGTTVLPILHSVHYDPEQFEAPEMFDPAHFLGVNGAFKKNDAFMPFSAGKRMCIGEGLARMELFLFLTSILQNFTLKPSGAREEIDITPEYSGLSKLPRQYQLCLIPH
ncbi:cytochrome P450 2C31-like isoform X2 [Rhinatrema bivittatum]|uniref:cytochrome P450 2C31-like isoform X2 n=1 Tax=Rhinatrema bivittatum TaxID=194408 RepID=UPI001128A675|nr:cytochrome P450 2C31-like isoform X2 [Rhinatrema bivittatum]